MTQEDHQSSGFHFTRRGVFTGLIAYIVVALIVLFVYL